MSNEAIIAKELTEESEEEHDGDDEDDREDDVHERSGVIRKRVEHVASEHEQEQLGLRHQMQAIIRPVNARRQSEFQTLKVQETKRHTCGDTGE